MTQEEIVTALLVDIDMPYLQDWQARDIVDFVLKKYTEELPTIKGWVARNIQGFLKVYGDEICTNGGIILPNPFDKVFEHPEFGDAPIKVELIIREVR